MNFFIILLLFTSSKVFSTYVSNTIGHRISPLDLFTNFNQANNTVIVKNCTLCNGQICVLNNINNTLYFSSCICSYPLCGERCEQHLHPLYVNLECHRNPFCFDDHYSNTKRLFIVSFGGMLTSMVLLIVVLTIFYFFKEKFRIKSTDNLLQEVDMLINEDQNKIISKRLKNSAYLFIGITSFIFILFVLICISSGIYLAVNISTTNEIVCS